MMTDAEINLAIAKIEYPYEDIVCKGIRIHSNTTRETWLVNYVNDWVDIGPIIEREEMQLMKSDWLWVSHGKKGNETVYAKAETPAKAAAICYLKMIGG